MAVPQTAQAPLLSMPSVQAPLNFLVGGGEKPKVYIGPPEAGVPQRTGEFAWRTVDIADARALAGRLSLDREGFEFHSQASALTDFYDEQAVRAVYYPEIVALLKAVTGASRVHIFDHTIRVEANDKREMQNVRAPVPVVHNDYTLRSGPQRVRDLLSPGEAEAFLRHRFAEINVWRSIGAAPVQTTPLAVADAQSVPLADFVASDLVYKDRVGEIYQLTFNPEHRWYYFSDMRRDEVVLLKCYDSANDGRARFTAHSAFNHPHAAADAPPRESIEVRTLIAYAPAG